MQFWSYASVFSLSWWARYRMCSSSRTWPVSLHCWSCRLCLSCPRRIRYQIGCLARLLAGRLHTYVRKASLPSHLLQCYLISPCKVAMQAVTAAFLILFLGMNATAGDNGTSLGEQPPVSAQGPHTTSEARHRSHRPRRLQECGLTSRLGPKSQGSGGQIKTWLLWTMLLFHLISVTHAAADARVEPAEHHRGSGSQHVSLDLTRATPSSASRYPPRPQQANHTETGFTSSNHPC